MRILHFLGGTLGRPRRRPRHRPDQDDDHPAHRPSTAWSATSSAPGASTTSWSAATTCWGIVLRQPIYEKDRLTPVSGGPRPGARSEGCSRSFPSGYRHLAYIQTKIGYDVKRDMPGLIGPEVEDLYRRGAEWLAGAPG